MPEPEPTKEELRALALRALWKALERDPRQTTTAVSFPDGLRTYLDVGSLLPESPEAEDVGEIDLGEVAVEVETIWSVSSDDQGAESYEAYDLGDDFVYVAYSLTEIETGTLQIAVPKRLKEQELAAMRSGLLRSQLLTPDFAWQPTGVSGFDLERADSLRTIASALDRPGFGKHVIEEMCGGDWEIDGGDEEAASVVDSVEGLEALWITAVRCEPPGDSLPPGFALLVGHPRAFEDWLKGASVRWADTGDPLSPDEVRALRLTCLFLDA
jgi:hypothetical protein